MPTIPPTGEPSSTPSQSANTNQTPPSSFTSSGGQSPFDQFLAKFTPEERTKFLNILCQNISNQIQKASQKYIEELKKERQKIEEGD